MRIERFYSSDTASKVTVREGRERRPLEKRLDLAGQSADGFAWGNEEGEAQHLALALLADALSDDVKAVALQHEFTSRVVNIMPARWTITRTRIMQYVEIMEYERRVMPYTTACKPSAAKRASGQRAGAS